MNETDWTWVLSIFSIVVGAVNFGVNVALERQRRRRMRVGP